MSESVLDASALLAMLKDERFDQEILDVLDGAVTSAINFAEVITKLIDLGMNPASPETETIFALLDRIEPFTETQARIAGDLRHKPVMQDFRSETAPAWRSRSRSTPMSIPRIKPGPRSM